MKSVYTFVFSPYMWLETAKSSLNVLGVLYVYIALGVVIPGLFALNMDLYLLIPLRMIFAQSLDPPSLHLVHDWALGLMYLKVLSQVMLINGDTPMARGMRNMFRDGWFRPDVHLATKRFILPLTIYLLVALGLPVILGYAFINAPQSLRFLDLIHYLDQRFEWFNIGTETMPTSTVYLLAYPVIAVLATMGASAIGCKYLTDKWWQEVRDEIYMVGELLHNVSD